MALSNEMHRLTQGFLAAHDDRIAMVAAIRDNTTRELSGFRAAHQSMAVETTRELSGFRAAHQSMAVEQRQRLADYVYGLRDNVANVLKSLDTAHESMAAEQRQRLADGRTRLASDVRTMRGDLADYVYGLRDNIAKMLESFDTAHESMAVEQRRRLATGRTRLASDVRKMRGDLADYVDGLRDNVAKMCGDLHADRSEARKILNDFATVMRERRAKKSSAPSLKAPKAKAARPPITVAEEPMPHAVGEVIPDDLTIIGGIGAGRQQRLNEMGIYTFAQLAGSTPQKIRKALGTSGQLANVEQWIEEARKLSSAPGDSE